jgi:uncharacterized membrane protein YtjA (UPF0391 family)
VAGFFEPPLIEVPPGWSTAAQPLEKLKRKQSLAPSQGIAAAIGVQAVNHWHALCIRLLARVTRVPRRKKEHFLRREFVMLYWAAVFLIIALIAAVFGFGGIAASAAGIAKLLFVVFLILFIVSLLFGGLQRPVA